LQAAYAERLVTRRRDNRWNDEATDVSSIAKPQSGERMQPTA